MESIRDYFNAEAEVDLRNDEYAKNMGIDVLYDEVEKVLNEHTFAKEILVLGCGSGLDIERIKFPAHVTGIDIADKMIESLRSKSLYPGIQLDTICSSLLAMDFGYEKYDIVQTCFVLHHFNAEQKQKIFNNIHKCLKTGGVFINGDLIAINKEKEDDYLRNAEELCKQENAAFASIHIDAPLCFEHEKELLRIAGFNCVDTLKEWSNTKLYTCTK